VHFCDHVYPFCFSLLAFLSQVQSRLATLYPDYTISRMAAGVLGEETCALVANAPVYGDAFQWHIDADPACVPPG
jgi:hypothetical protein